ncbi:MAG TPA: glycosyltransferase family 4 protein [Thermoleophilaceae bacterium]
MRVLFTIHHHLDPNSGAPGVTWQLMQALRAAGHEAEIYSWDDLPKRLGPRAREALFPEFAAARISRARREGVDVVDAATCDAWLWSLVRRGDAPALITRTHGLEHTFWDARRRQARESGEQIPLLERVYQGGVRVREAGVSLRHADGVLFLNEADRERGVGELGVRAERAHVVANGVPEQFLGLPEPEPRGDEPLRLVQVGSWAARKGVRVLVEAVTPLLGTSVELTLVGTSVGIEEVIAEFSADARGHVRVVPRYEHAELPALLRDQHALVLPSYAEGFSLALVEGMACGLAPVATEVGAAPDLLTDGENGLLIPPGDAAALRSALERLAGDGSDLQDMRERARARAQDFSWSKIAADTVAVYERVLSARSGGRL